MRTFTAVLLLCLIPLVGCSGDEDTIIDSAELEEATAEANSSSGHIAFVSDRDGDNEIFVMNADGSNQTQLTFNDDRDSSPVWSPNGRYIAFESASSNGDYNIFVMDADGSNQTQLTFEGGEYLAWSPDSRHIVYVSPRDEALVEPFQYDIFVMDANGSNRTQLTFDIYLYGELAWSPDGRHITFDTTQGLYVMDADGGNQVLLPFHSADGIARSPAWSPDGERIAFHLFPYEFMWEFSEIFVMDADGSNQTPLTFNDHMDEHPVWSPDGRHIAFYSNCDGDKEVFVIDANGDNETQLTFEGGKDFSWGPDGHLIAFTSRCDGNYEICVMDAGGGNLIQLTSEGGREPVWSPTYISTLESSYEVSEAQATESLEQMQVIVDALRLRDKPNTDTGDKIGLLEKDDVVEILQRWEDWVKVRTEAGLEGWACIELDGETFLTPAE